MNVDNEFKEQTYPNEPNRFTASHLEPLLEYCVKRNASDVIFQTNEPVLVEIYGRLHKITHRKLTNTEVGDLLNFMYGPNGTTQLLSGSDVDTHFEIRPTRADRFRFRVNGTGCQVEGHAGIQVTLRTIPNEPPKLSELGLPQSIIDAIAPRDGVVYVTGATGSGKSTLLAAIIRSIAEDNLSHRKILTYESPIEFVFDAIEKPTSIVAQSEIPRNLPSFAAGVRNALRRTPRLILVGEARDIETMSAVLEAALTGHPVYTTLHANGVAETIRRLVGTFPQEERNGRSIDIIETIRLIIWQQLAPTVDGKRMALREFLVFDEEVRDKLLSVNPEQATAMTRRLVKERGQPMIVDAERAFKEGRISERTFNVLSAGHRSADRDAGV
ncbi:MAG: Dot/Icm type IV secretion system ATPase DotB [Gammaproteobacteria bacterium]|nr:Dot/Icm type IV secretion system ATPase DotB [Gammaproteobacteria bacterium]